MLKIPTASEMRWCDEQAIKSYGIPGLILMENAARGTADMMQKIYPDLLNKHILIVCGKGNNGGDGYALARHLFERGCRVTIASMFPITQLSGDGLINARIIQNIVRNDTSKRISLVSSATPDTLTKLVSFDIIVDAILGTGIKGKLHRKFSSMIEWINDQGKPVISIDIPSGVEADTGNVTTTCISAHHTCTMGLPKVGLYFFYGQDAAGKIHVIPIQIPPEIYRQAKIRTYLVEKSDVKQLLPKRRKDVHKYNVGKVFVLAGSVGLTGAAALCSVSTLRSGAGAVVLGIPESLNLMMEKKLTEVMTLPLADDGNGVISATAWERIEEQCEWADVVVAGPGLSRSKDVKQIVINIVSYINKPLVLDADALNVLSGNSAVFKKRNASTIITPHAGEFARISDFKPDDIMKNKIECALRYTKETKVCLILKGGPTIIATVDGKVFINSTGNPGMATAGSGDVLSGLLGGLMAQGMSDVATAQCGVYIHGKAGDQAAKKFGNRSITAGDIQNEIVNVLKEIEK